MNITSPDGAERRLALKTLPFSRKKVEKEVELLCHQIASRDYDNPLTDTDSRQRRMFQTVIPELLEAGWTYEAIWGSDASNIAIPANKALFTKEHRAVYRHTQTRAHREGTEEDLRKYLYEFYVREDRLEKIVVALGLPDLGDFPGSGCLRSTVHFTGIHLGHSKLNLDPVGVEGSRFDYIRLIPPAGMSRDQAVDEFARKISGLSNDCSVSTTRPVGKASRSYELGNAWERALNNPAHWADPEEEYDTEDFKKFATEYFDSISYFPEPSVLGDIVAEQFSNHRGQPLPRFKPLAEFRKHFPKRKWIDQGVKSTLGHVCQIVSASRFSTEADVFKVFIPEWIKNKTVQEANANKKEIFLWIEQPTKVTSLNTVLKNRDDCIESLKAFNTSQLRNEVGLGLIRGVVFPKHLDLPSDSHVAYEWNDDQDFEVS